MTQGDLEKLPGGVGRLMKDLENRIMEDIVRRIRQNCFSTATADWQITRLAQLGESEQYIQEYVMQALQATEKELDEIFSDETYREYMGASRGYKVFGQKQIPFAENRKLQSLISAVKTQTKDELENITRTMGFVKKGFNNRMTVQSLSNFYRKTMDNAVMDIASGAFSYNEVLKRTINEMTQSGIRTIDYSSGVHNRIDVAARRAVLTGFRQVQGKINEQVANDLGTDSYEVTVHIGARPTHQVWEGKVYTYQQLVDVCGLGSVTGLKGANCYHDYNAFIPGVSVRTYTDEQLDQIHEEENKKRLYNGKEYTTYEALQRQRELERHARKYREDVHLLELGGGSEDDINASKGHYRRILAEYGDFSKKMDLPLQKDRIYHDGLKVDMDVLKNTGPVSKEETEIPKVIEKEPEPVKIEIPDTSRCVYRTEKDYKKLAKEHAKNTSKLDIKQIAKHTKLDGSPGGYVATHNYQTINCALLKDEFETLCDDDKATVIAMRRAISGNILDQDSILTRYVNADYITSVFGVHDSRGKQLANSDLLYRKGVMQEVAEAVRKRIGTVIPNKAFISTSMMKDKNIMQDKSVRMTISAVKGTHCYLPKNKRESELIFSDNTKLYISDVAIALDGKLEIFAVLLE